MKRLKKILRWVAGIVLGLVLTLLLLINLPFFQRWMAGQVAGKLSDILHTRVEIDRIKINPFGRVIVDDMQVWDQKGKLMLDVARTAAQVDVWDFVSDGLININSAQLYGADATLYKEHPDSADNFKFVIEALTPKDTTKTKTRRLKIGTILVRHGDVTYDKLWQPRKEKGLDINHIGIKELSIKASLNVHNKDSFNLELDKVSLQERSGFKIKDGEFVLTRGKNTGWNLEGLEFLLPFSRIKSSQLIYNNQAFSGDLSAEISPHDMQFVYPQLEDIDNDILLDLTVEGDTQQISLTRLGLTDRHKSFSLNASGRVDGIRDSIPLLDLDIHNLSLASNFDEVIRPPLTRLLSGKEDKSVPHQPSSNILNIISKLGESELMGHVVIDKECVKANTSFSSQIGDFTADGTYREGIIKAHLETDRLKVGDILSSIRDSVPPLGLLSSTIDIDAQINGAKSLPEGKLNAIIQEAEIKGYTYKNIKAELDRKGELIVTTIHADDPSVQMDAEFRVNTSKQSPFIQGKADVRNIDFTSTNLASNSRIKRISTLVGVDFKGNTFENMQGFIASPHIIITGADTTITLTNIKLESLPNGDERDITLTSPYLTAHAKGAFTPWELGNYMMQLAHNWLPDICRAPSHKAPRTQALITATINDLSPLEHFIGDSIELAKGPLRIKAKLDDHDSLLVASAAVPSIKWGSQEILNLNLNMHDTADKMSTNVRLEKIIKGDPIEVTFDVKTTNNKLETRFAWDNHKEVKVKGEVMLRGSLERNAENGVAAYADVLPTQLYINDTLWTVSPAQLYFRNKELFVDGFTLSMNGGERSLSINGTASADEDDTINVDLKDIDLSYIFTLAKVKPISLGGYATGRIVGRHVFKNAFASGSVTVPHFLFNEAHMGACQCYLAWGDPHGTLILKAQLDDIAQASHIDVDGYLHLLKDPVQHMDLSIDFKRANAAFMQRYVKNIMNDFTGRASGNIHIYGKFREIDVTGDAVAHECAMTIPSLNTRYYAYGDTVKLRPGYVAIENVTGYDRFGKPGQKEHSALINGRISYEHFRNMHFRFDIDGNNILAYDTREFGDMPFYATAYGTGKVHLDGGPGFVNIDIDATPDPGTVLTYNASSPETLTHAGFISFVDRSKLLEEELEGKEKPEDDTKPTSDMNINFKLNLTPESQLRLLMDPRTDDYISLFGSSSLQASYYNKGRFRMYGTYHVDHGTYKMTLQEVIHKDFQFRKGGSIVFTGNPFEADLGLQAVYTVPSVSLNDLSARGTFSNSTVRVNCIMNLGGKAGAPRVTFDFDIPNVNDDELRMVRSLISTEEERNMQVIYLLGIGRFYTYDYTGTQAQSSTAMNSLLSSTLSGQLNQMINTITGSTNWNFGANLSTGTTGWSDMDVEGMLSGRLLNNRLLINGNFGYRDNPVAASNFIGDFDIQWLLNKSGNLVLKAYSETNDRYFTKSSLTTQGIGLMVKKDFNNLHDLFGFLRKKKQKKTP